MSGPPCRQPPRPDQSDARPQPQKWGGAGSALLLSPAPWGRIAFTAVIASVPVLLTATSAYRVLTPLAGVGAEIYLTLLSFPIFLLSLTLFAGGYGLQFLGHLLEGTDPGEIILLKKRLGWRYVEIAPARAPRRGVT